MSNFWKYPYSSDTDVELLIAASITHSNSLVRLKYFLLRRNHSNIWQNWSKTHSTERDNKSLTKFKKLEEL